ncbi:MAG: MFS transporter [Lentisphaerae bacterium]|nr:MFS transporter [Lentisphaerota bacterium]
MGIYFCPALMDFLVFFCLFSLSVTTGMQKMGAGEITIIFVTFQVAYLVASLALGHFLSRRIARGVLLAGTALSTLSGMACLFAQGFWSMVACLALFGVFTACFFNAFQTVMRGEAPPGGLTKSVAFYTMAWSTGSAFGFWLSGLLFQSGRGVMFATALAAGIVMLLLILSKKTRPCTEASADEHVEEGSGSARRVSPAYVMIGWLLIFTAMLVQRPFQNYLPSLSAKAGEPAYLSGLMLGLNMFVQGMVGYAMIRFRDILYRRTSLWIIQLCAALVCLLLWKADSLPARFAALGFLGAYFGYAFFCAVYYASNSGRRSFNTGVNECLVGLGSVAGLAAGTGWMKVTGSPAGMFLGCAIALAASTAIQIVLLSRPPAPGGRRALK